jgi:hypothetical protein
MKRHGYSHGAVEERHGYNALEICTEHDEPSPCHCAQRIFSHGRGYERCTTTAEGFGIIAACTHAH